jgi:hypothetical protein
MRAMRGTGDAEDAGIMAQAPTMRATILDCADTVDATLTKAAKALPEDGNMGAAVGARVEA